MTTVRDGQRGTIAEQFENSGAMARQIGALVSAGWRVVVTHLADAVAGRTGTHITAS